MAASEVQIVDVFCSWLEKQGWAVRREQSWVDVVAERDGEKLYAEAKGQTSSPGLDVDTLYGQLLRRMTDRDAETRYAVVVPAGVTRTALRVPKPIRDQLRIDLYEVLDGEVRRITD